MIHYHGTPCGATREDVAKFLKGRHALIPWVRPEDIATAAEVCQSFCLDNGAFSAWKSGQSIRDWSGYYEWVEEWHRHPGFDWAIIPDVIDGTEEENDALLDEWPSHLEGVPVWHFHESLERLDRLCAWPRLALGSSGEYAMIDSDKWWRRTEEAMDVICVNGRPRVKLHGLRMLDPEVFTRLPLASADSTNAVRNSSNMSRFGMYAAPNASTRMAIIAERSEAHQSAPVWIPDRQQLLFA
ncbi:MAG: hypothetical protein E6Q97_13415 [Desulfurellales bacterium]|nr:MAG: hypothetical protein E6Q97_13415 [Desulfurellales bacterium]